MFVVIGLVVFLSGIGFTDGAVSKAKQRPVRRCPVNQYFSDRHGGVCKACRVCRKGHEVVRACTATSNTVCRLCPRGTYNSVAGSQCRPCKTCQPGQYRRRQCTPKRNTSCKRCRAGTYSEYSGVSMCRPCQRCGQYEQTTRNCSSNSDAECGGCLKGYFRDPGSSICLPCSECPKTYSHRVVSKCMDDFGHHIPTICWPSRTTDDMYRLEIVNSLQQDDSTRLTDIADVDIYQLHISTVIALIILNVLVIILLLIIKRTNVVPQKTNISKSWRVTVLRELVTNNEPSWIVNLICKRVFKPNQHTEWNTKHGHKMDTLGDSKWMRKCDYQGDTDTGIEGEARSDGDGGTDCRCGNRRNTDSTSICADNPSIYNVPVHECALPQNVCLANCA